MQFHISKTRYVETSNAARIEADITLGDKGTTIYFSVPISDRLSLIRDRADPFVVVLLPMALHFGYKICFESPISEIMAFKIETELSPTLSHVSDWYRPIKLMGPTTSFAPITHKVATGFSGGVDSLYTIYTQLDNSIYPLTDVCVFNSGVFESPHHKHDFSRACLAASRFAKELNLSTHFVDTNFVEMLPERFLDVYSFRNIACALSLGGSISTYLLSSGHDVAHTSFDAHNIATYDLFNTAWLSTEYMSIYSSGSQLTRFEKLKVLSAWPVSYQWLHPCIHGTALDDNCGICKKCRRDFLSLYVLGALDRYRTVLDVDAFLSQLRVSAAFVATQSGNHLYDELLEHLDSSSIKGSQGLVDKFLLTLESMEVVHHE